MVSRRFVFVVVLSFIGYMIPAPSFASSGMDFTNSKGTISGSTAGLSLSGSELIAMTGFSGSGTVNGKLGLISFANGVLSSGSWKKASTFATGGSYRSIDVSTGTLFTGSFSGPVTWALVTLSNGTNHYTPTGIVTGTSAGSAAEGVAVQLTINAGKSFFDGPTTMERDDKTFVGSVPEPSTLSMLGTGAVGLLGGLRRKFQA